MTTDGQHIRKGIIIILPGKKNKKNKIFFERILYPLTKSSVISL